MPPDPLTLPSLTGPPPPGSRTVTTDDGVPLHVEFDGAEDAYQVRYTTWDEAEKGHAKAVAWAQARFDKAKELLQGGENE